MTFMLEVDLHVRLGVLVMCNHYPPKHFSCKELKKLSSFRMNNFLHIHFCCSFIALTEIIDSHE